MFANIFLLLTMMVMLAIQSTESLPAINQAIRGQIEQMRTKMPKGLYGSPSLVPYRRKVLDIDYKQDNMTYLTYMSCYGILNLYNILNNFQNQWCFARHQSRKSE